MDESEPKGSGRLQLQGVLDELVQQRKEVDDRQLTTELTEEEEAAKSLVELPNSIKFEELTASSRKGFVSPKKRRRRRKKELVSTSDESDTDIKNGADRHIPHVMTLFDRKVDLARFSEATPLYVMCRDWMRNKPQGKHSPSSPPSLEQPADGKPEERVVRFPSPLPLGGGEGQSSNIPTGLPPHGRLCDLDNQLDKQVQSTDVAELKEQHIQRWKTVRSKWISSSISEQERYKDSLKILRDMFQR